MRKMIETGRFTIRNPIAVAREKSADHPMVLFATLAGAAMMAFAFAPQASAADAGIQVAALTIAERPVSQPAPSGVASDRVCAGQAWGHETSDCLIAVAKDSGAPAQAKIRIIEIQ